MRRQAQDKSNLRWEFEEEVCLLRGRRARLQRRILTQLVAFKQRSALEGARAVCAAWAEKGDSNVCK